MCGLRGFEFVHDEEAARNLALGLGSLAICHRGMTYATMKESAERPEALKANFKTDVSYAQVVFAQQFFRLFNATMDEVLMWSLVESLPK